MTTLSDIKLLPYYSNPAMLHTSLDLPVAGMRGFFLIGGSLERAIRNGVRGGTNASVVGDPAVTDGYLSLRGGVDYLQWIQDTPAGTHVVVARSTDTNAAPATRPTFCGVSDGSDSASLIHVNTATVVRGRVGTRDDNNVITPNNATLTVADVTQWGMYFFEFDAAERRIHGIVGGAWVSPSGPLTQTGDRALGASPITIGGGQGAFWAGSCDVALYGYAERRLFTQERQALYDFSAPLVALGGVGI